MAGASSSSDPSSWNTTGEPLRSLTRRACARAQQLNGIMNAELCNNPGCDRRTTLRPEGQHDVRLRSFRSHVWTDEGKRMLSGLDDAGMMLASPDKDCPWLLMGRFC